MEKKNMELNGFLVFSEMNSEGIYMVNYDLSGMSSREMEELRHELEDLYRVIDSEYSATRPRKRSFKVKYVSAYELVGDKRKKVEHPVLSFYVVPHRMVNWIKQSRKLYYSLLSKYAIKIQMSSTPAHSLIDEEGEHSHFISEKSLYLLPTTKMHDFEEEFKDIRKAYALIHARVRDFAYSPYFDSLNKILEKHSLSPISRAKLIAREPRADYNLMVIEMGSAAVNRWMESDPMVAEQIRRATAQFVAAAVRGLEDEIHPLLQNIRQNILEWVKGKKDELRFKAMESIDSIQEKLDYLGIGRIESLDAIRGFLSGDVELTEADLTYINGLTINVNEEVDSRLQSFVEGETVSKREVKEVFKEGLSKLDEVEKEMREKKKVIDDEFEIEF